MVVAPDVATRSTSPPSSRDVMASPLHSSSSDGSTSSDYLSLSENLPALSPESASPRPSSSSSGLPPPWPWWLELLEPVMVSPSLHGSASPHPSSSGSSIPLGQGLEPPSPLYTGSDQATSLSETYSSSTSETYPPSTIETYSPSTIETYSSSDKFTPSHRLSSSTDGYSGKSESTLYASASGGSLSSHYFSALDGSELVPSHHSIPEGLAPSHHLTSDGSPPSEAPADDAEFFNENMMKKLKIVAGVVIIGGTIASIVGSQIKHRD